MRPAKASGITGKLVLAVALLAAPTPSAPANADPGDCITHPAAAGCPITSPADPRCNASPGMAGCMGGAPTSPTDPRCIANPTSICTGGIYDPDIAAPEP